MYLTITIETQDHTAFDMQVNEDQTIENVLKILNQYAGCIDDMENINFVQTMQTSNVISKYYTFKEAEVLNGDKLKIL